jgi:catechol 2,3-dioxygenase-like lactoylglutathione lyase family enzyme
MKSPLLLFFAASVVGLLTDSPPASPKQKPITMKLNPGIVTEKLNESKAFYQNVLGFGVRFENEFFVLLHSPDGSQEISFLLPDHPSQQKIFHSRYEGKGMYLTIEVPDVDEVYNQIKAKGIKIEVELRDEPWGDRHFAFFDPNGIGIDIVTYKKPD